MNTSASVPRLIPLYSARTTTVSPDNGGSVVARISPRPGATIQNARAAFVVTSGRPFLRPPCPWSDHFGALHATIQSRVGGIDSHRALSSENRGRVWRDRAPRAHPPPPSSPVFTHRAGQLRDSGARRVGVARRGPRRGTFHAHSGSRSRRRQRAGGRSGRLGRMAGPPDSPGQRFRCAVRYGNRRAPDPHVVRAGVAAWQGWRVGARLGAAAIRVCRGGGIWSWLRRPLAPTVRARAVCVAQILGLTLA